VRERRGTRVRRRSSRRIYRARGGRHRGHGDGDGGDLTADSELETSTNRSANTASRRNCRLVRRGGGQRHRQRSPKSSGDVAVLVVLSGAWRKTKTKSPPPRQRSGKLARPVVGPDQGLRQLGFAQVRSSPIFFFCFILFYFLFFLFSLELISVFAGTLYLRYF
jgi:hypothetical protein